MSLSLFLPGFLGGSSGDKTSAIMVPEKMKQWTTGLDGVDKLQMDEVDVPAAGEGEVLVKIHAVSLNYRDNEGELATDFEFLSLSSFSAGVVIKTVEICG